VNKHDAARDDRRFAQQERHTHAEEALIDKMVEHVAMFNDCATAMAAAAATQAQMLPVLERIAYALEHPSPPNS
jgi:hypothetical protein